MNNIQRRGVFWAVIAAVISGVAVFANGLVVKGMDPLVHNVVKNGLVGMGMLIWIVVSSEWRVVKRINGRQWGQLGWIALIGGSIPFFLFFTGVKVIGGVEGALIQKTLIFWVAMMAIPLLKEKVTRKMWLAVGLLYGSNLLSGFNGFKAIGVGHLMVLTATLMWAVENIIAKKTVKDVPVNLLITARMLGGAIILLGILGGSGKIDLIMKLTSYQWLMLAGVALLLAGYVNSWYRALKYLPATLTAGVLVGATIITTTLEAIIVKHNFGVIELGQAAMILSGIYLVIIAGVDLWRKKERRVEKALT